MFSFISVSWSCSFFKYLGTVQERYHKEKREFFYPGTDSFKTRNMDKPSLIIRIRIYQPPPPALRFSQGRGERLMNRRKGPWEGYRRQGGSPFSPSRLPLRTHVHRESDVWVRGSRYTLHMLVEWLVLDYSLSVRYLGTKNVHIKVFILDMHFGNRFWLFGIQFWICYSFCFLECRESPRFFHIW